jgi:hypothetical protein
MIASEEILSGNQAAAAEVLKRGLDEIPGDDKLRDLSDQIATPGSH